MKCRICSNDAPLFQTGVVLKKYTVSFFQCRSCGFMQTEEPYWLPESYAEAINQSDVGIVDRNVKMAKMTKSIISCYFNADAKFIDYGGGTGLFVRMMRDYGFDFYWYDAHCQNVFARGFEADPQPGTGYELVTAFEVMEHLADPLPEIERMLKLTRNVLFTTTLRPRKAPNLDQWWYYELDHGQHVSFFTFKALAVLAEKLQLKVYSDGWYLHLLTDKNLSSMGFKLLSLKNKAPYVWRLIFGKKSLIPHDQKALTGMDL
ncbi:MAG: class I SAM-dependent methyltransferase [Nitrospirae bacterium]|nr:class I SAM-dependent methyltransferase [Nitrospirota bacterium]NTW65991.1 class I SAM-dependent methyltransferase [Nitrospirota bacterium]